MQDDLHAIILLLIPVITLMLSLKFGEFSVNFDNDKNIKASNDKILSQYKSVNLKFDNQVICTKK